MSFKTQAEIYQALLDGKKLKHASWPKWEYIYLLNGNLVNDELTEAIYYPVNPIEWSIYEEPKPKKQVWQWRYFGPSPRWLIDPALMDEKEAAITFAAFKPGNYEKHAGPFEVSSE